jgi:hypothetical protein
MALSYIASSSMNTTSRSFGSASPERISFRMISAITSESLPPEKEKYTRTPFENTFLIRIRAAATTSICD